MSTSCGTTHDTPSRCLACATQGCGSGKHNAIAAPRRCQRRANALQRRRFPPQPATRAPLIPFVAVAAATPPAAAAAPAAGGLHAPAAVVGKCRSSTPQRQPSTDAPRHTTPKDHPTPSTTPSRSCLARLSTHHTRGCPSTCPLCPNAPLPNPDAAVPAGTRVPGDWGRRSRRLPGCPRTFDALQGRQRGGR